MALLEIDGIHTYYGAIHALKGISVSVEQGEIVTLIGANGAGKSTTLNTICGLLHPRKGSIILDGEPIHELPAHEIVMRGVSQAPEGRRVFGRLNVTENLEMGAFARSDKPEGALQADSGHAFGRRAADVVYRPLVDGQPAPHPPR
jgi:branched-chain amino acid transport system ATP-binding protein